MAVLAVIPARFASTRFPGKPLALIAGKPMVQHVFERCSRAGNVDRVIIATEDVRIVEACKDFNGDCEMTSPDHASGTDRVAEIARRHPEFSAVLNVQGDEPGIAPETVNAVAGALLDGHTPLSTAISPLDNAADLANPNVVKVVTTLTGGALYFSRSPIPFHRDGNPAARPAYFRHLGIYGFQRDVLLRVTGLSVSPLERAESLEQLRWLQSGFAIQCVQVPQYSIGVDTPEDLKSLAISFPT
ncbi:MAG TPA: 3-deoxy-manno-octulosonate cytidylyltransferase [bacterium]|jgi:3-deoxy-manno-octulosonate cytidylyltransferase (CMP-KDO synthetase)